MAGTNLGLGRGECGLSLFRTRPGAVAAKTYSYDLVTDFGAVPGDVTATTAALHAFNDEAQRRTRPPEGSYAGYPGYFADADKDHLIVLNIPAGRFSHRWNRFAAKIRRLKIIGAGSDRTFLENQETSNPASALAFTSGMDYWGSAYDERCSQYGRTPDTLNVGHLIHTVPAGATRVQLKGVPDRARRFLVGRWVLVHSYSQQQYGYPPNLRYYDWAVVTALDDVRGTISLDRPLAFEHRDDRPYFGDALLVGPQAVAEGSVGPARIAHIDHPGKPLGIYHEYRGFQTLPNPNWNPAWGVEIFNDVFYVQGYIRCQMSDLIIRNGMGHAMAKRMAIRNSSWAWDESDKIVGEIVYDNCDVAVASEHHAGQLLWRARGGHLHKCSISCREARLEDVLIDHMLDPGDFHHGIDLNVQNPTQVLSVEGCTFRGRNHASNQPIQVAALQGPFVIGTGSDEIVLPGGNGSTVLRIDKDDVEPYWGTSWQIVDNWDEGHTLWKNGVRVDGSEVALITGDADYVYVACTGVTFDAGDTVAAARLQKLVVQNCIGDATGFDWASPWLSDTIPEISWTGNRGD